MRDKKKEEMIGGQKRSRKRKAFTLIGPKDHETYGSRWREKQGRSAFTLIELIVVMAIIGILVLLAAPKFLGYTEKARHTKLITTSKELERASERYFMDFEDWPRLTDDAYTADEIHAFAEKIYDISGEEVTLDPAGNYYDIDYDRLRSFIKEPDDKKNYVLRNPVGKIYALENVNKTGKDRVAYPDEVDITVETPVEEPKGYEVTSIKKEYGNGPIVFSGMGAEAFDNNPNTYVSGVGFVTWTGDLAHREIEITAQTTHTSAYYYVEFLNDANTPVIPVGRTGSRIYLAATAMTTTKLIVPEGATKMQLSANSITYNSKMRLHDIKVPNVDERPININMDFQPTPSSMKMTWDTVSKAIIYRDGVLRGTFTGQTYTDTPLYSDKEYKYDVVFMDANGNGQKMTYTTKTAFHIAAFSGMGAEAFDNNPNTYVSGVGFVTWTGDLAHREIEITAQTTNTSAYYYVEFLNAANTPVIPVGRTGSRIYLAGTAMTTTKLIVPEGATKMQLSANNTSYNSNMRLRDINIIK